MTNSDPESLQWDFFDEDLRKKLDGSPYVSLSRDRAIANGHISSNSAAISKNNPQPAQPSVSKSTGKSKTNASPGQSKKLDEAEYEIYSETSDDDGEFPEGSLFQYDMPGVLKKEEVEKLDLDHWKLVVRNMLIDMEVSRSPELGDTMTYSSG